MTDRSPQPMQADADIPVSGSRGEDCVCRRAVLAGLAATVGLAEGAAAQQPLPNRPRADDLLVYASGPNAGQVIRPEALERGARPLLAWPMDPQTRIPRSNSRLNQVLVLRMKPEEIEEEDRGRSADGILAFSSVCTHAQCPVNGWVEAKGVMRCPCHESEYDPRQAAKVVFGPAPRPLPALPLRIAEGELRVAGPFTGRVGMAPA